MTKKLYIVMEDATDLGLENILLGHAKNFQDAGKLVHESLQCFVDNDPQGDPADDTGWKGYVEMNAKGWKRIVGLSAGDLVHIIYELEV